MIAPCSCGVNLLNDPVRRSGYQIPHGHAGLSAARRGRRKSQSSRSVSKPEAYVRPNIASSGFCERAAKGSALSISRSPVTKKVGSSLIDTRATPRGSLTLVQQHRVGRVRLERPLQGLGVQTAAERAELHEEPPIRGLPVGAVLLDIDLGGVKAAHACVLLVHGRDRRASAGGAPARD